MDYSKQFKDSAGEISDFVPSPTAEQWLETVVDISRQIANLNPLPTILKSIVSLGAKCVHADIAAIALLNHDRTQLLVECFDSSLSPIPTITEHPIINVGVISRSVNEEQALRFPLDGVDAESKWECPITGQSIRSAVVVPLSLDGTVIGALWVARVRHVPFKLDVIAGLAQLADQTVIALEHASMASQIQSIAIAEERYRIAREMHDSLAQVLGYLNIQTQTLELLVKAGDIEAVLDELAVARHSIRNAQDDVRDSILSLRTTLTNELPLPKALEQYAVEFGVQSGLDVHFESSTDQTPPITPRANAEIIRIVQEALTNVRKHARANAVEINLMTSLNTLIITIADDGIGFDLTATKSRQFGLTTMKERAQEIGGSTEIVSQPDQGTTIRLQVPLSLQI